MVSVLLSFYFIFVCAVADDADEYNTIPLQENTFMASEVENTVADKSIEISLQILEKFAADAEKSRREGILPIEHADELHSRMVETLEDITEQLSFKSNTYKFLNSNGVDRVITPVIGIDYEPLKRQLLFLIKTLFNVAPITTKALIPISVIDKLLNIFEHEDNLALKTHALEIMHAWLPNNPKVQARVMRLKGLEPFYNQFSKLDFTAMNTLLDLFNKILKEHLDARSDKSQVNNEKYDTMQLYRTLGLVERMSTPRVCNGILNILETLVTQYDDKNTISFLTFELVKNVKTFCLKTYKGKDKAIKLFNELRNYVRDQQKIELMRSLGVNTTEVIMVVEDFVKNLNEHARDEF